MGGSGSWTARLLLLPGTVWLLIFFAIPMLIMLRMSLTTGSFDSGFELTWNFGIYPEVIGQYWELYLRSGIFALLTT